MAFDLQTAKAEKPKGAGFDLQSAKPAQDKPKDFGSLVPLSPQYKKRVEAAYADGDAAFGDFLIKQAEEGVSQKPAGFLEGASSAALKLGHTAKKVGGAIKEAFTGKSRQTDLTETFPEIGSIDQSSSEYKFNMPPILASKKGLLPPSDLRTSATLQMINLSSGSTEESIRMLKGLPSLSSMFKDEKDNVFAVFKNGYIGQVNKPGPSGVDATRALAQGIPFALASRAAGGGAFRQMGSAMATQTGLELIGLPFGGTFDESEIMLSGIVDGIGTLLTKGVASRWAKMSEVDKKNIKTWRDLKGKIPNDQFQKIKQLKEATEKLDAPPTLAAQFAASSQTRFKDVEQLKTAVKNIDDAEKIAQALKDQDVFTNKEVKRQVQGIFAGGNALEAGTKRVKDASESIFEDMDAFRRVEADKAFGKAFANNAFVDMKPIRSRVRSIMESESIPNGEKQAIMKRISHMLTLENGQTISAMRGRMAQEFKFEIDNLIKGRGETSLGKNTKDSLEEIKRNLIDEIDNANPGYKAANAGYAKNTSTIEDAEDTIIGIIRDTGETKIAKINKLFDEKDVSSVNKTLALLRSKDEPAVFALYKSWLEDKMGRLAPKSNNSSLDIYKELFGTSEKQRRLFQFAPSKEIRENLVALRDYLEVSKNIRVSFSGGSTDALGKALEVGRTEAVQGPKAAVYKFAGDQWQNLRRDSLSDIVLNPRWAEEMRAIKKLPKVQLPVAFENLINLASKLSQAGISSPMAGDGSNTKLPVAPK